MDGWWFNNRTKLRPAFIVVLLLAVLRGCVLFGFALFLLSKRWRSILEAMGATCFVCISRKLLSLFVLSLASFSCLIIIFLIHSMADEG